MLKYFFSINKRNPLVQSGAKEEKMPKLRRIQVNFDDETVAILSSISKKKKISISKVTIDLVNEALEMREDIYLSKLAEEAEEKFKDSIPIPAEVLWKELGLL